MAKTSWNPWMNSDDLREVMDRLVGETLAATRGRRPRECGYLWKPAADIYETDKAYVIQVELPGFDTEQVVIEIRDNNLWVYGERRFERDAEAGAYLGLERCYGPFARQFVLPQDADHERISAVFKNGLLTLTVSKITEPEARHIRIEVS